MPESDRDRLLAVEASLRELARHFTESPKAGLTEEDSLKLGAKLAYLSGVIEGVGCEAAAPTEFPKPRAARGWTGLIAFTLTAAAFAVLVWLYYHNGFLPQDLYQRGLKMLGAEGAKAESYAAYARVGVAAAQAVVGLFGAVFLVAIIELFADVLRKPLPPLVAAALISAIMFGLYIVYKSQLPTISAYVIKRI